MDISPTTVTEGVPTGGEENYLVVGLAVGIPCAVIILALLITVIIIVYFTLQTSGSDIDEVEATYMRRRFQGLSLEEQRKIESQRKSKKKKSERITTRRSSSTTNSSKSSFKLSPYSRRAKIRKGNPFGLQDWQLKMSGIDASPSSEEVDFVDDSLHQRNPIGALNPLMLDESTADYEPAEKGQKSSSDQESNNDDSSSSDSMNPYD